MKTFLFLTVLFLSTTLFAKDLTVTVLDGWKSKPIANCTVILKSNIGIKLREAETDAAGVVIFTGLSRGKYQIITNAIAGDFDGASNVIKLKKDGAAVLIMRPTESYVQVQWQMEDSIYGIVRDLKGTLSKTDTVEIDATFRGGDLEMKKFIQQNVFYPEISRELGDQGRIYVRFIVEPDGVITHVDVLRELTPELDREAKRLVRAMPNWTPGIVENKNVRARCTLPITFTLM